MRTLPIMAALMAALVMAHGLWAAGASGSIVKQARIVGQYRLLLQIGPPESMGNSGDMGGMAATCHMAGMPGSMGMKTCNYHVELHVLSTRSKRPVRGAHVAISLRNRRTGATITVPIMTMGTGSDFHYGNNIYAPPGTYIVLSTVNGANARFSPVHLV